MLWVQVNASNFCVEPLHVNSSDSKSDFFCPTWAGGKGLVDTRNQTAGRFHSHACAAAGFDATNCKDWQQTDDQAVFNQAWINIPLMSVSSTPGPSSPQNNPAAGCRAHS